MLDLKSANALLCAALGVEDLSTVNYVNLEITPDALPKVTVHRYLWMNAEGVAHNLAATGLRLELVSQTHLLWVNGDSIGTISDAASGAEPV